MLLVDRVFFHSKSSLAGTGSGVAAAQARPLPPFTRLNLVGANNLVVHVDASQSVIVHADDNLLGRVTTRVLSGTLVIGTTPGNLNAKTPMYLAVSLPSLNALTLQGHGTITATGIDGPTLTVLLPGSGTIQATGATTRLDVRNGGSGTALLSQLTARDVKAALSGHGTIIVTATHSLNASVSSSGSILYSGNPSQVSKAITGNGTITAR